MSSVAAPSAPRSRQSPYAEKLFARGGSRSTLAGKSRRRREQAAPSREERLRALLPLLLIPLAIGLLLSLGMRPADTTLAQRPDPAVYRSLVDLVSIDRVGTMFCATVSQGFFLETAAARQARIEALVLRVKAEGYGALYLFEASGRTLASWNGERLEITPDGEAGS